ncbi:MAG: NFACT RNA binding domain-containing protein [Clostridia bacterium]
MAMDGLALRAIVAELQPLVNGKIDKIQQPEKDLLLFTVRSERSNVKLLIHTHAENGRIQLTGQSFDNPLTAPAFCMLLRRHLLGGRIASITQEGPDRICTLSVSARNELMDNVQLRLVIELMGKHANVILVDGNGVILDCLRHISPSETTLRVLLPGFSYQPAPVQPKKNPFTASEMDFTEVFSTEGSPIRTLTDQFEGISKSSATMLLDCCRDAPALCRLFAQFSCGMFSPVVLYNDLSEPITVLPFVPVASLSTVCMPAASMSEALDRFYMERDATVRTRRHGSTLKRTVENALARAEHKYVSFQEALTNDVKLDSLRLSGELILANLHAAKPGMAQLVAQDYYADPPVPCIIALDASISPQENATRYFKQYRKGKLARDYAAGQVELVKSEMQYLSSLLISIENSDTLAELDEIREELVAQKYLKPSKKGGRKQFSQQSKPLCYISSDGILLYVGKNNLQNDRLTLKTAQPDNFWLHAKGMPGSHVIIDFDGLPPEQTLLEAAMLAAFYSSGKTATTVPIDYTPRKYLKKPSGARPGMVVYSTNKTLFVTPDAKSISQLKQQGS